MSSSPPLRGSAEWSATREVALLLGLAGVETAAKSGATYSIFSVQFSSTREFLIAEFGRVLLRL